MKLFSISIPEWATDHPVVSLLVAGIVTIVILNMFVDVFGVAMVADWISFIIGERPPEKIYIIPSQGPR